MLIDSHCHLDFPEYDEDRAEVLARAREAGVGLMLAISTTLTRAPTIIKMAEAHDDMFCTIGIHPHEAETHPATTSDALIAMTQHPKVVGIGETGLDYFRENSPRQAQQDNFRKHIAAARSTGLPLIVHTRDADEDTCAILEEEMRAGAFPGLIHCFTAGADLAQRVLDIGFYISVSGIATFKNATAVRDVLRDVPLNRLLVETDAPFLAPVPHRGARNEPAFVAHTAAALAELKGVSAQDLATATTDNFFRLFTKAAPQQKEQA